MIIMKVSFKTQYLRRNGEPVTMEKKLLEELYTILEESNIEGVYKTMDLAQFTFANKLEVSCILLAGFVFNSDFSTFEACCRWNFSF